jgi:hypothetical protein
MTKLFSISKTSHFREIEKGGEDQAMQKLQRLLCEPPNYSDIA